MEAEAVEAEAIGVEAEAVDKTTASTTLIELMVFLSVDSFAVPS